MLKASTDSNWLPLFEALASDVRLRMINLLAKRPMSGKELAGELGLSSAIITMHIRKLEKAGLVSTRMVRKDKGTHKICALAVDQIEIQMPQADDAEENVHEMSIPIGHYTRIEAKPTCGLATRTKVIGQYDDPRYFMEPERMHADILWFSQGFVEYTIPNYLLPGQKPVKVEIALEIGSEAPEINENYPSDIRFSLNGTDLCTWTSPGDFGEVRGKFTPDWWHRRVNQYGLLKVLSIQEQGTYMDGQLLSQTGLANLELDRNHWTLRLSVDEDALHVGGLTLFGKGFGNYNQDIMFRVYYEE
ncbi:ArsR/SmtB family transcription factor [Gorillibacterium massiliense]|uniref:ArsR/SmtB family transcription factor n=1 Tax=Gorillibacterium massiliense TaxID=1280390 RepID=UPI0004B85725|nr:ArsR family transcriptional regulator [Gorillibacterium massiliense]